MSEWNTKWDAWVKMASGLPTEPGWYATLMCFDAMEGFFPTAFQFDGEKWDNPRELALVTHRSPGRFETEDDAIDWAYEHDPDDT